MARTDALYLTESETAKRLGKSLSEWRGIAIVLERDGLPPVDPLFGARYWPAVRAFFDRRYHLTTVSNAGPSVPDGKENFDAL